MLKRIRAWWRKQVLPNLLLRVSPEGEVWVDQDPFYFYPGKVSHWRNMNRIDARWRGYGRDTWERVAHIHDGNLYWIIDAPTPQVRLAVTAKYAELLGL